jgi:hypothetical protein
MEGLMNVEELQRKLIAAARALAPSDRVPYAFEQRVLAHLRPLPDAWAMWSSALWRAAAPCLAIVLLLGIWSWFQPTTPASGTDLSEAFENTVLAAVQEPAADSIW